MIAEHTFDTGTVVLNYAEGPSSGSPLVLLHGGAGCWQAFLDVIPGLADHWHVYAPDLRGHGRSGRVPAGYRWQDFVDDTTAFLRQRLSEPAVLWGSSFGGTVALGAAAQAADRVRALVLEDPWLDPQASTPETRQFLHGRRELVTAIRSLDEMIAILTNEPGNTGDAEAEIRLEAEALLQLDPEVYTFGLDGRLAEGYNLDTVLKEVACPVLFLQADSELGGLVDDGLAADAISLLSQATLVKIPGAGHAIRRSQPEAALRAINSFLGSL